jgi:DNA polymerase-2
MSAVRDGFVLTRHARDGAGGIEISLWLATGQGPLLLRYNQQRAICFIPQHQQAAAAAALPQRLRVSFEPLALRNAVLEGVSGCYFQSQQDLRTAAQCWADAGILVYEADVRAADRFLMERFVCGGVQVQGMCATQAGIEIAEAPRLAPSSFVPQLKMVSLDIETAMDRLELFSIGVYAQWQQQTVQHVFLAKESVAPRGDDDGLVRYCGSEMGVWSAFVKWLEEFDPDIIIGWSVVAFDLNFLARWCEARQLPFAIGRNRSEARWLGQDDDGDRRQIQLQGRVVLDGIDWLKQAGHVYERFSLEFVARQLLDDGKLLTGSGRGEEISHLFEHAPAELAAYNIKDCELVWRIFEKTDLLGFAIARSQLTGLALGRTGGSVAAFDFRYLPLLHRAGFVAPDQHHGDFSVVSPGGYVMDSQPGLYDSVVVLDFKSLYPSIIRSFLIDPLGLVLGLHGESGGQALVPGFDGAMFARSPSPLPDLIAELWRARDVAKASANRALDLAVKILMNSFYGVLGSPGCRFFDPRLASSITRRGHQIIQDSRRFIEARGYPVIYGDTDSLFVWLKHRYPHETACELAQLLVTDINAYWHQRLRDEFDLRSALEIKFEAHYRRFFMPTIRGSEQGSKKRYAGLIETQDRQGRWQRDLIFKGLESVRSDWTRLAKQFQHELYRRIFCEEPFEDYVRNIVVEVRDGRHDDDLVYRKRLRAALDSYQRNVPPHVQAARKLQEAGMRVRRGDTIEYVICRGGAFPVQLAHGAPDYAHYIERQLAPPADSLLQCLGTSFAQIVEHQISLF